MSSGVVFGKENIYRSWVLESDVSLMPFLDEDDDVSISCFAVRGDYCVTGFTQNRSTGKCKTLALAVLSSYHGYSNFVGRYRDDVGEIVFLDKDHFQVDGHEIFNIYRSGTDNWCIKKVSELQGVHATEASVCISSLVKTIEQSKLQLHTISGENKHSTNGRVQFHHSSDKKQKTFIQTVDGSCTIFNHISGEVVNCPIPNNAPCMATAFYKNFFIIGCKTAEPKGVIYIFSLETSPASLIKTMDGKQLRAASYPRKIQAAKNRIIVWDGTVLACYDFNYTREELTRRNACTLL